MKKTWKERKEKKWNALKKITCNQINKNECKSEMSIFWAECNFQLQNVLTVEKKFDRFFSCFRKKTWFSRKNMKNIKL